jgi:Prokaryotic phospholipase A2
LIGGNVKRWTRPILAILLGVLAICYVGMVPAQAAERVDKTEMVITYRGYTLSWSQPDASDLRVVRTPGRVESLPDAASKRSIQKAKSRVTSVAQQQASDSQVDSCNLVPDSFGDANFTKACNAHDDCYRKPMGRSRLDCDLTFLKDLTLACTDAYRFPSQFSLRLTCLTIAGIYFVGVRLFGASSYTGNGGQSEATGGP